MVPVPPSVNGLWRAAMGKSRRIRVVRSRRYAGWLPVAVHLMRAGLPRFAGPVSVAVTITGGKGFPPSRDLDNCLKPVCDALRHADRIAGDSVAEVVAVSVRYEPPSSAAVEAHCVVEVCPA